MSIRSAQSITVLFTTRVFSTGVATNADSLPTGTLYVNGTADAATVTVSNITTGLYKAAVTLPTLAYLDVAEIRINATVSSVADNCVVWRDTKDIAIDSSGVPDVNVTKLLGTAWLTPGTAGTPDVNMKLVGGQTASASGTVTFPNGTISTLTQTQVTGGTYALDSASFAFNAALDFTTTQKAATLARVTLADTLTTYTGNTPQTGDSYARIGAAGAGLTAIQLPSNGLANVTAWTVNITGNLSGSVGSVTGAVGSVTGNVGGNVVGSVASVTAGVTVTTNNDKTGYSLSGTQAFNLTGNITGNLSGSVGSVTGAVGSVTGNVTLADGSLTTAKLGTFALAKGTNITGFNDIAATAIVSAGAITTSGGAVSLVTTTTNLTNLPTMPTDWITASGVSAGAVTKIQTGITPPTAAAIADAVWDEVISGHLTAGTTGAFLNAAGAAGDPWGVSLPASYGAGTAGYQFANMNAIVSLLSAYPGDFTVTSPMNAEGSIISLFRGDDFKLADGRQIPFSDSGWSLTGSTVQLLIGTDLTLTGTVTSATACYFEVTKAQTKTLTEDAYPFEFKQITAGSNTITLATGVVKMSGQIG